MSDAYYLQLTEQLRALIDQNASQAAENFDRRYIVVAPDWAEEYCQKHDIPYVPWNFFRFLTGWSSLSGAGFGGRTKLAAAQSSSLNWCLPDGAWARKVLGRQKRNADDTGGSGAVGR